MDILKRLSGWTDGMRNADVYKLAHDEIESLRAQLSKPQPTPSQSELLAEYDAVLRALCSYLSAGGYNDEADQLINPKVADEKIRWGIDQLLKDNQPQPTSQDVVDAERWCYFIETCSDEAAFELTGMNNASNKQINAAIDAKREESKK